MIINITEEQKKVIESQGCMIIIQFKAGVENFIEWAIPWYGRLVDVYNMIWDLLKQMVFIVVELFCIALMK